MTPRDFYVRWARRLLVKHASRLGGSRHRQVGKGAYLWDAERAAAKATETRRRPRDARGKFVRNST